MHKPLPLVQVAINRFSKKGNGRGTFTYEKTDSSQEELSIEVPFTCPGDIALVEWNRKSKRSNRKQRSSGKLLSLIQASPERIEPLCAHFGTCGGCRLQHVPYDRQIAFKETMVKEAFAKLPTVQPSPLLPAKELWHYRNKMEFSFSQDREGNRFLGLMMEGGRGRVLNLTECHLVSPWFIDCLKAVRAWWESTEIAAYHPYRNTGSLRTLILRESTYSQDRLVMLTVSGNPDYALSKADLTNFTEVVNEALKPHQKEGATLSVVLRIQQAEKGEATNFYEMILGGPDTLREGLTLFGKTFLFQISPTAFFQTNTRQAGLLFEKALELADLKKDDVVYDLYCGTGTFGILLADRVAQVIGIELSPEAILDAKANMAANGIANMHVLSGAVRHVLSQINKEKNFPPPSVIAIDPPRSGLDPAALSLLIEMKAPKIIYISCNPETQSRDLEALVESGYTIEHVQPVDQFPQTYHIENIAILNLS